MRRSWLVVLAAVVASAALLAAELSSGGWSYGAARIQDPCHPHRVLEGGGADPAVQRFVIRILDRLACRAHKSREEYILDLADKGVDVDELVDRIKDLFGKIDSIDDILRLLDLLGF